MSANRRVFVLLYVLSFMFLIGSFHDSPAFAAPPSQGGYDHQAAARFVGDWQGQDISVRIEDRQIAIYQTVIDPQGTFSQLCPNGASSCQFWAKGPSFSGDGKMSAYWVREDNTQVWSEVAILSNGHLLWTVTLSYSQGGTGIIREELTRVSGSTQAPESGGIPTLTFVLPTASPYNTPPVASSILSTWTPGRVVDAGGGLIPKVYASDSPFALNECTDYVYKHRADAPKWAYDAGNASAWADLAQGRGLGVDRGDISKARPGDIVVWSGNCGVSSLGHVAMLVSTSVGSPTILVVNEANHCSSDGTCDHKVYEGSSYSYSSSNVPCLSFIHQPATVPQQPQVAQPPAQLPPLDLGSTPESQSATPKFPPQQGPSLLDQIGRWFSGLFGN